MRLLIDKNELELLLEKKREFIGNKVTFDTVIAGISFLLSVLTASYDDVFGIQGIVLKTVFCTVGVVYVLKINLRYITSRVQEKYSVSHDEKRTYNHRLYELQISDWPAKKQKDFVVNGKHYYWMSIADMEKDKNIVKKNLEVVDFVKELDLKEM